ncbi:nucleotidyltransferase family protein [Pseudoxanthomonas winnipegensis]|uniref:Nucleotidyltransferase family protein n=1 Tax=Pseudoxanthomonas winnipegensis TaxID=2480810 RepID=A0ABY1WE99_9GAMM|nr:nucleotidyltransferase family protein [Pseudoxanthomonas winnipegensis]TAA11958.1 nucleotidyltransferase family protein [Pseudoxanthomonas winnipegensis]TAA19678.1 nucleotidyltransferase family protein [Pseudoxanthomonas winnipegensis]TAH70815.1 nucleotidyltransferase family protein [Pseudoxanthomonas winnipegensis]
MSDHIAVVLAAGGSRRLGRAKQLLPRAGEPLVCRAVRLARATAPLRLLVVVGARATQVSAAVRAADVETVMNRQWREGLAASVRAARDALAIDARGATRVLLLACDQPALEAAHLQALLEAAARADSGCAGTVHGARIGIPAVVTLARLAQAQPQGDAGLRELLNALTPETVGRLAAPELELDLDTPADLVTATARGLIDPLPSTSE